MQTKANHIKTNVFLSDLSLVGLDWLVQRQIEVGKLHARHYCLLFNVRTNRNEYLFKCSETTDNNYKYNNN